MPEDNDTPTETVGGHKRWTDDQVDDIKLTYSDLNQIPGTQTGSYDALEETLLTKTIYCSRGEQEGSVILSPKSVFKKLREVERGCRVDRRGSAGTL